MRVARIVAAGRVTRVTQYQVDAFARRRYEGNPAAVVLLQGRQWPSDLTMQRIANENNLSETAYVLREGDRGPGPLPLRWFTPEAEVDLCGHATLATAHVVFTKVLDANLKAGQVDEIVFETRSGDLFVERTQSQSEDSKAYRMTFPIVPTTDDIPLQVAEDAKEACAAENPGAVVEILRGGPDLVMVFDHYDHVANCSPDMSKLNRILSENGIRGCIVTAWTAGKDVRGEAEPLDFVSRFFAPNLGINEDPATGSAHCCLALYWAAAKGLVQSGGEADLAANREYASFKAKQMSPRGGYVDCALRTNDAGVMETKLVGEVCDFMEAIIELEEVAE